MNKSAVKLLLDEYELADIKCIENFSTVVDNDMPLENFASNSFTIICNKNYNDDVIYDIYMYFFTISLIFILICINLTYQYKGYNESLYSLSFD